MQKITRIYVGNYGYQLAWYDGIIFDLTDPGTSRPTDSLINLENGGGKTSLLSLIFSCFETAQERFLKHIQTKSIRFADFFSKDGLPSIVLIEWEMPSRVAGGTPYRLVMGQIVAVRGGDKDEVDRAFFSFESTSELHLRTVPAPNLSMAPVHTMSEFSRWMQETTKASPDFFHTKVQQDWQRHLRDERLIDIEMLQMQVNFSAQEGGIDAGFLTFSTEAEFLKKFLALTMDAERSASVRQAVVDTCDKLRRRPTFQLRLAELEKLQTSLEDFASLALFYQKEQQSQRETLERGGGVARSLEVRHRERQDTAKREAQSAKEQLEAHRSNSAAEKQHVEDEVVLRTLQYRRRVAAAKKRLDEAEAFLDGAKEKHLHIRAAQALLGVKAAQSQLEALENQAREAHQELAPWRTSVEFQGALLRRALHDEEMRFTGAARMAENAQQEAVVASEKLTTESSALDVTARALVTEAARLRAAEENYEAEKSELVKKETLESAETSASAIERWEVTAKSNRAEAQRCKADAEAEQVNEKAWRKHAAEQKADSASLAAKIEEKRMFLGEGQAEHEALSQLEALREAAEATTADPDSPALPGTLGRLAQNFERMVTQSDVVLAELIASKVSIEDTGVAGSSRDVDSVIAWLQKGGVQSARPYNTLLAQAIDDADKARRLVASNPARFLGVCIASSEFALAASLTTPRPQLRAPVMVSVTSLDPDADSADQFVLSASDDAAFNVPAARVLLATLEARLTEESGTRTVYADKLEAAVAGKTRLKAYLKRFGDGALATAGEALRRFTGEMEAATARAADAESKADDCRSKGQTLLNSAADATQAAKDADSRAHEVCRFVDRHESGHIARLERLEEVLHEQSGIAERRAAIVLEFAEHAEAKEAALRKQIEFVGLAKELGKERAALKYYDKDLPAAEHLKQNPRELALLRSVYADAVRTYESEEKDRLGVLQTLLGVARDKVTSTTADFQKHFSGVYKSDMAPYQGANFDELLRAAETDIHNATHAKESASNAKAVVDNQADTYSKANKPVRVVTREMHDLDDNALAAQIVEVNTLITAFNSAAQAAKGAADLATNQASKAAAEAASALDLATTLRTVLSLPDLIVSEPVVLVGTAQEQVHGLIKIYNGKSDAIKKARDAAYDAFDDLKTAASEKSLQEVEPEIATQLQRNDFSAACADSQRLLDGIRDRIGTARSALEGMQPDFDAGVGEMLALTNAAISLLNSAVNSKKVPVGAPYVGGKSILKMRARFSELTVDTRRQALHLYLESLIASGVVPAKGPELVAEALLRIYGKPLGLQILKMVPDESLQYVLVDKIANSGGEGVVMAMFLYLLINQLRSETQAQLKKLGGGPLILDNPFAKATTPTLWKAQRMLAQSMDVQLIFATAVADYNSVGEFNRIIRLRKAGRNSKTGRWHLEAAEVNLRDRPEPPKEAA
ncbi:conserved hypothetical protein [Cupriavidus taiwanensis]|uniref:hypothetical protein n=1 Tax=Cupriavidus taiwanensis TaxID=164546 RepID=UPI000E15D30D|nr:hypothetical protein [Cupriavidus taiwanensis]SPA23805.1 conserved hypothetical protein [Cupriavidus taiwanensis]